jgi:3-oxoacyl-[acyl-carrier protein] reductase
MTIIVSGGTKGIGLAFVAHLLNLGHQVATFARTATPDVEALAGDKLRFMALDISDGEAINAFVDSVARDWGQIHGLVNNAGTATEGVLPLLSDRAIDRLTDINLKGTLRLSRAVVRRMLKHEFGRIVNIASIVALRGYPGLGAYSATKAAIIGLTQSMARELGSRNITVNAIAPGFVDTDMTADLDDAQRKRITRRTPLGRLAAASDLLPVLDLLLREDLFMTGQTLVVDGGLTC